MKNDRDVASLVRAFRPTIRHVMSSSSALRLFESRVECCTTKCMSKQFDCVMKTPNLRVMNRHFTPSRRSVSIESSSIDRPARRHSFAGVPRPTAPERAGIPRPRSNDARDARATRGEASGGAGVGGVRGVRARVFV